MVEEINTITNLSVPLDPKILILGITELITHSTYDKLLLFYLCFYARKALLQQWKLVTPPTVNQWRALVDAVLPLYKLTYMGRKCPKKFDKVWKSWVTTRSPSV